jgi:2-amino-4-hydroxy-6-hydroxymethyldihydropteridine diphosphokinase
VPHLSAAGTTGDKLSKINALTKRLGAGGRPTMKKSNKAMSSEHGRARERVFLSLGSNVGRRPDNLRLALRLVGAIPGLDVVKVSRLYSTSPVGYTAQREFLNGVVELRTNLNPRDLLERLAGIEARMGKSTPFRNGPRRIDIDVVLFDDGRSGSAA